jgi:hypothetical protein
MKQFFSHLLAGLLLCAALAVGASAAPPPQPKSDILWYAHADGPDGITSGTPKASELQALGITGVIVSGTNFLRYNVQNRRLSLEEVRASIAPVVLACAPLPVWLELGVSRQAGNPLPTSPARTLYAPRGPPEERVTALDNLATIGQAAKEAGIPAVGFDFEAYGVQAPYTEKAEQLRPVGVDLATALRRNYGGVRLFGFAPLSFYRKSDGFRGLARGFYAVAGSSGVFFNEDSYGLARQNVKALLSDTASFTHAQVPACGWWPGGNAADPVGAISQAAANARLAMQGGRPVLIYHEGAELISDPARREALKRALGG